MAVTITRPQRLVAVVIPCKGANARTASPSPHQKANPQTVSILPPQAVHAEADRIAVPAEARSSESCDVIFSVLGLTGGEPRTKQPIVGAELETGWDSGPEADAGRKRKIDGGELTRRAMSHKAKGPSKRKRKPRSDVLVAYEEKKWGEFVRELEKEMGIPISADELLLSCQAHWFKTYIDWLNKGKRFRIEGEGSMESYWKRISQLYHDKKNKALPADVFTDVEAHIKTLGLRKGPKEKRAIFAQDFFVIQYTGWALHTTPLHGLIRVQLSLLLLLSAVTGSRPDALLQICFEDIEIYKVRSKEDFQKTTFIVALTLLHTKNDERGGRPKKFSFRLEEMAAFCFVSHIIAIGFGRKAFCYSYTGVEQAFGLRIPNELNALRIDWDDNLLKFPFFCDTTKRAGIHNLLIHKRFPYQKYRESFIKWGIDAGIPGVIQLYDLRRAAGSNLNTALPKSERDQVLDHSGDTYNRYYVPTHIAEDFQAIYFGTPSQKDLIQSVSRIGFLRDPRAPKALTEEQKRDICNDPKLSSLAEERGTCLRKMYECGYKSVKSAEGKEVSAEGKKAYDDYKAAVKAFNNTKQKLLRNSLFKTREEYFKNVHKLEISAQLRGEKVVAAADHATPTCMQFEIEERATFVGLMSKPASSDEDLILRIRTLANLCHKQETRRLSPATGQKRKQAEPTTEQNQRPASCRKRTQFEFVTEQYQPPALGKHSKSRSPCTHSKANETGTNNQQTVTELQIPMLLGARMCGFCLCTESLPREKRMKVYERQDVFDKHIGAHFRGDPKLQAEFQCYHPSCTTLLKDSEDFKRHDLDVHGVRHGVPHRR